MNEVTCFMLYMFNKWSVEESRNVFGVGLGQHVFAKWEKYGAGRELLWYAELDSHCRRTIVERAKEWYENDN